MTKQQSSAPKLSLPQGSRPISKFKPPKIRIIHIVAPEIINTDAANFRELVQALTGKPGGGGAHARCTDADIIRSNIPEIKKEDEDGTVWTEEDDSSNDLFNEFVDLDGFIRQIGPHELPFMSKSPPRHHLGVFGDHPHIYR